MAARDEKGRFANGNSGGPGRPKQADYAKSLRGAVSVEDWSAITSKAVSDAKSGNAKARDWLSKYLIPNPLVIDDVVEEVRSRKSGQELLEKMKQQFRDRGLDPYRISKSKRG